MKYVTPSPSVNQTAKKSKLQKVVVVIKEIQLFFAIINTKKVYR